MGLTRIRADQISNIDYKQAVRVITVANVTLSGGAPNSVDGVNLSAGDRVLVQGQGTGSQNGIYVVTTLGTGSNGTWTRSVDGNETGEIEAGMIIMVTEGDVYKDTQWKLTTNNPIVIGSTALVFEQNSAFAFGNIYANGTAVLADAVGGTVTFTAGDNITITGNNTVKSVTISATGGGGGGTPGGSDTFVQFNDSGTFGGSAGFTFNKTTNAVATTGTISATGTVTGTKLVIPAASNSSSTNESLTTTSGNIGVVLTESSFNVTTNLSGIGYTPFGVSNSAVTLGGAVTIRNADGNVTVPSYRFGLDADTGIYRITTNTLGIAAGGQNTAAFSSSAVSLNKDTTVTGTLSATGNITGGNLLTGGLISATGTVTGTTFVGVATSAQYADLAEYYIADADYPVGTVLAFGGDSEVTQSNSSHITSIAGTVSDLPAYIMNSGLDHPCRTPVALMGRVPCRVIGRIRKGDRLAASDLPGVATVLDPNLYQPGCIVGKALEDYDSSEPGIIEVVVGRL